MQKKATKISIDYFLLSEYKSLFTSGFHAFRHPALDIQKHSGRFYDTTISQTEANKLSYNYFLSTTIVKWVPLLSYTCSAPSTYSPWI